LGGHFFKPWRFWNLLGISIWDLGFRSSTDRRIRPCLQSGFLENQTCSLIELKSGSEEFFVSFIGSSCCSSHLGLLLFSCCYYFFSSHTTIITFLLVGSSCCSSHLELLLFSCCYYFFFSQDLGFRTSTPLLTTQTPTTHARSLSLSRGPLLPPLLPRQENPNPNRTGSAGELKRRIIVLDRRTHARMHRLSDFIYNIDMIYIYIYIYMWFFVGLYPPQGQGPAHWIQLLEVLH
jgi:hypothetical protein